MVTVEPGPEATWFLPLGGCGEIGMNLNLYGHNGRWLMVDCGITFEQDGRGRAGSASIQMPDPDFIASRRHLLDGLIITHAHEDHLGPVPYLWSRFQCPVYTTPFTASVLRRKIGWRGGELPNPMIEVVPASRHQIGVFDVEWLPLTHSTPETCALSIRTPGCHIIHTADWKIDQRPVVADPWKPEDWKSRNLEQPNAVICDSTNAMKPGRSPSEGDVADGLLRVVAPLTGKVVIGCFASNIARLQTILRLGHATGRRVGLLGRSLENMYRSARATNHLATEFCAIDAGHLDYLPKKEILALATGSQGEIGSALHRLAMDSHPKLCLDEGDTVIFSAKTIPGNEQSVDRLIGRFQERGIQVLHADNSKNTLHASGHPCEEELRDLYNLLRPEVVIPVHGEQDHMAANGKIARGAGAGAVLTGTNGDLFYIAPTPGIRRRWAPTGRLRWLEDEARLEFA